MTAPAAGAGGVDREAIRAREQAATPGPWRVGSPHNVVVSERWRAPQVAQPMCTGNKFNDASFIAHAREDVPDLLAALAAAEQRADTALALHPPVEHGCPSERETWAGIRNTAEGPEHYSEWECPTRAALSSRPVQPDTERSET